ncbi:polysaccharide deacetylase family protein [Lysobacter soyae]|uniref:Polysaccharide deacetylase family protein n=1 Tax=Lysobacter soyae TaxID=2764185 RepID=A0ABX8WQZ5_9GAMM|nr:polysaccharide deacetylase family protein [Lysobacter sp. CJ11]QYR53256.1 polysaccharide deacetylase family protein [Lysobacter sp. CJ11]
MTQPVFHTPPRHPHVWWFALLASQLFVVWLWIAWGWKIGLPAMLLSHAVLLWGVLYPGASLYSPVLRRLPTQEKSVWLTIDDGPSEETPQILDVLEQYNARATFFLVGDRAEARPALAREIVQRGHGIGNHSQSHPQAWFWALGPRQMRQQIEQAQKQLEVATGVRPHWFRAVVGMANPFVSAPLKELNLARVGWSARGFDAVNADDNDVIRRVEKNIAPGAIILMHEGAPHGRNVPQLRLLLARLDALGYKTVLPEEL